MHKTLAEFTVGLLVKVGGGGGGELVPSSCSWPSLFIFLLPRRCGGSSKAVYFFRWRVIGLGLWVQIGTADGRKCFAVDAMLLMEGVVLGGGCKCLDTRRTPFGTITCGRWATAEGIERGDRDRLTAHAGGLVADPGVGLPSG